MQGATGWSAPIELDQAMNIELWVRQPEAKHSKHSYDWFLSMIISKGFKKTCPEISNIDSARLLVARKRSQRGFSMWSLWRNHD